MMDNIHRTLAENGLVRARQDKLLGGVASGLGRRIGVEPWPARLLFVLVLLLLPGQPAARVPDPVDPDAERGEGHRAAARGPDGDSVARHELTSGPPVRHS